MENENRWFHRIRDSCCVLRDSCCAMLPLLFPAIDKLFNR
jgi:hypothetical protein